MKKTSWRQPGKRSRQIVVYGAGAFLVCMWMLVPSACKKSPPHTPQTPKDVRGAEDFTYLFAGDTTSLAEYEQIQRDIQGQSYQKALQGLEKMALRSPDAPWIEAVKFTIARTYMMMADYRRALDLFDRFVKEYPSSTAVSRALMYMGEIYLSMGAEGTSDQRPEGTSRYYVQKSITIFEDIIKKFPSDKDLVAQAQYLSGSAFASLGDYEQAIRALEKVVADYKDSAYAPRAMYRIAGIYLSQGKVDVAEQVFGRITAEYPHAYEAQKARKKLEGLGLVGMQASPLSIKEWVGEAPREAAILKDKVVVLSFWAIWCPHCRRNIPRMDRLVEQYGGKGVVVIGITREKTGYESDKIREFIKTHPMRFSTGIDDEGKTSQAYAVSDIPCVVVIDKKGKIRWHGHPDFVQDELLDALLSEDV